MKIFVVNIIPNKVLILTDMSEEKGIHNTHADAIKEKLLLKNMKKKLQQQNLTIIRSKNV